MGARSSRNKNAIQALLRWVMQEAPEDSYAKTFAADVLTDLAGNNPVARAYRFLGHALMKLPKVQDNWFTIAGAGGLVLWVASWFVRVFTSIAQFASMHVLRLSSRFAKMTRDWTKELEAANAKASEQEAAAKNAQAEASEQEALAKKAQAEAAQHRDKLKAAEEQLQTSRKAQAEAEAAAVAAQEAVRAALTSAKTQALQRQKLLMFLAFSLRMIRLSRMSCTEAC